MKARGTVKTDGSVIVKASLADLERYIDKDIDVEIKIHREKRSLSANAYFYVLLDQIASKAKTSVRYQHNLALARYGFIDTELPEVALDPDIEWLELEQLHLRYRGADYLGDKLVSKYAVIRGSHTYNSAEMARLIDGVVDDAKALGIETLPPDEIARMEAAWQAQVTDRGTKAHRPRETSQS